jgi:hypothetical protein
MKFTPSCPSSVLDGKAIAHCRYSMMGGAAADRSGHAF